MYCLNIKNCALDITLPHAIIKKKKTFSSLFHVSDYTPISTEESVQSNFNFFLELSIFQIVQVIERTLRFPCFIIYYYVCVNGDHKIFKN